MANTSAIWQQATYTTCELSSPSYSTRATQQNMEGKNQENRPLAEKNNKTERARGLGRKTRGENPNRTEESNGSPEIPDRPLFYSLKAAKAYGHYYEIIHLIMYMQGTTTTFFPLAL